MFEKGYYSFRPFDGFEKIDRLANSLIRTFVFDKDYSISSINQEKIKHNFSTRHWQEIIKNDKAILAFDLHGISPEDVKVTKIVEDGTAYIKIEGKTKNEILDCEMEVDARWAIPYKQYKKPTKQIINSILYVFVEPTIEKEEVETI